jgi:hypothetical protein
MKRTGNKERIRDEVVDDFVYVREYECPSCGRFWLHDELTNSFTPGTLEKKEQDEISDSEKDAAKHLQKLIREEEKE